MQKQPTVKIPSMSFPGSELSGLDKTSKEFGLRIGQAIQHEWFYRAGDSCRFYSQWSEFHRRRLYANAMQPTGKYKNMMSTDGDLSHLNLDFTPPSIIPKFVDIIVNGMMDREMTVKAVSQDIMSAEKRSKFQQEIEADMVSKDFLTATQDEFGVDAFNVDPSKLPEDNDELALFMNLNYKPGIEIASEIAIDTVLKENKYEDTLSRVYKDIVEIGIGAAKHVFHKSEGIKVKYVDGAKLVYSYTEDDKFKDVFYWGEVEHGVHRNELAKINPNLSESDLEELSNYSGVWGQYFSGMERYGLFQRDTYTLLHFNYKCRKEFQYKRKKTKTGGERIIKKDDSFASAPESDLYEKSAIGKDVWYEGVLILGTDQLLKWDMCSNMIYDGSSSQAALPNYAVTAPRMLKGEIKSHVERMIPFADQITLDHIKLQQIKARMVPDGVFIDADGINEVDLGTGAAYNPEDALRLYLQTGSVIGRSYTQDGEYNNARVPIQELNTSSAQSKFQALVGDYNHQMNMIRDVTGINAAADASTPDPKSLVGIQKMAAYNSNTATRHILKGGLYVTRTLAEGISLRISDVLKYSDMKDDFAMKIGKYNMEILDDIKNLPLCSFGIYIELSPDEEERQQLEADIKISLDNKEIYLEDAMDIRQIKNTKLANEMLKMKRRSRLKMDQQRKDVEMQMQAQLNERAQQMAAQTAMMKIQAEAEAKISVESAKTEGAIKIVEAEAALKSQLMDKEFQINMSLKGIEVNGQIEKQAKVEEAKDARIDRQSTQTSAIAEQKQKALPAIDFESTNDNLDDIDLSSFDPK